MISIAGKTGMLGKALVRAIADDPGTVPGAVIAAGLVGGIEDNIARPVNFLRANLQIALDFLGSCHKNGIKRVVYIGSSCMYPRDCPQPMKVADLMGGPLEPTNEGYALAKLVGWALCRAYAQQYGLDYRTAILCNLYGSDDRGFQDPAKAHVIPALARKLTLARQQRKRTVTLMGTGKALREFMHADDAASGILTYLRADKAPGTVNIGTGEEVTIKALAGMVAKEVNYTGRIEFIGGEDGMPRKVLESKAIRALGWKPSVTLQDGLRRTLEGVAL